MASGLVLNTARIRFVAHLFAAQTRDSGIQGGRSDKLRPGDILGALTTAIGLAAADIGRISITDRVSFVAVSAAAGRRALAGINGQPIKNRRFRAYQVVAPAAITATARR